MTAKIKQYSIRPWLLIASLALAIGPMSASGFGGVTGVLIGPATTVSIGSFGGGSFGGGGFGGSFGSVISSFGSFGSFGGGFRGMGGGFGFGTLNITMPRSTQPPSEVKVFGTHNWSGGNGYREGNFTSAEYNSFKAVALSNIT